MLLGLIMERYKPITPETRKSNRWAAVFFFLGGLVLGWLVVGSFIFEIDQHFVGCYCSPSVLVDLSFCQFGHGDKKKNLLTRLSHF